MTIVPPDGLQPATLRALIEEFVTRDGTRYGHREATLEEMVRAVQRQLQTSAVVIVFDAASETCTMWSKRSTLGGRRGERRCRRGNSRLVGQGVKPPSVLACTPDGSMMIA